MARLLFWRGRRRDGHAPLPMGSIVPGQPDAVPADPAATAGSALPAGAEPGLGGAVGDGPASVAEDVPVQPPASEVAPGPRVGLVFGDGTHVVLDPDDPRAGRFAALAEELAAE